ncbi:MAG: fibronectin type III domain-containing protein [bacterium]|nr:fibronectin type III domain-containing protein [bacterium]MDE0352794.1 fibronectin type III domain-containing protein [bacterium]
MRGTTHYKFHKTAVFLFVAAAVMFASSSGASAQSDESEKPARPVNIRVVRQTDGSVTLAWDVPSGRPKADGYTVVYRPSAAEAGAQPAETRWWSYQHESQVGPDNRQARVRDLTNGVWYELTVIAQYGDDQWEWSEDSVLARPGEAAPEVRPPPRPSTTTVSAEEPGSVTVEWAPPVDDGGAPVNGYEVWYLLEKDRSTQTYEEAEEVLWTRAGNGLGPDARGYRITGLVDYQRYSVIVAAVNDAGRGLFGTAWGTANGDDHDPLGLIADHRFARSYTLGADTWEVWVCDVADGDLPVDAADAATLLNREITPYFAWLSGGRYRPEFVVGGVVEADPTHESPRASDYECEDRVAEVSEGGAQGAVIVLDKEEAVSSGGVGRQNSSHVDGTWTVSAGAFPDNSRSVQLTAETVLPVSAYCSDCTYPDDIRLDVVAHEVGHALGWPHSFGGNRPETSEALLEIDIDIDEYDNPMDMISGSPHGWELRRHGLVAGTIAVNRYAAGWIDPDDVAVHDGGIASYVLAPIGISGTQMLVLPTGNPGEFISMGARVASGYDAGIPASGVEAYRVDQRASACSPESPPANPDRLTCTGLGRRTQQVPPPPDNDQEIEDLTDHVYGPGDQLTVEGFRVEVTERVGDRFRVWVGNPYVGTFADDENNRHEENIEFLANRGITSGCNRELKLYCPDRPVTRAQMATLLILALGEPVASTSGPSRFTDVPDDSWYRPYVERLAELEISVGYPDGTFRPEEHVTRAHIALFLTSAFDGLTPVETPTGVFDDVPAESYYAAAVEAIPAAGVTQGCNKTPGRNYCPEEPVRRDELASFLAHALPASS